MKPPAAGSRPQWQQGKRFASVHCHVLQHSSSHQLLPPLRICTRLVGVTRYMTTSGLILLVAKGPVISETPRVGVQSLQEAGLRNDFLTEPCDPSDLTGTIDTEKTSFPFRTGLDGTHEHAREADACPAGYIEIFQETKYSDTFEQ
ncbi:hypothetical protein PQX77_008758 [Marasmius sp. AFHP31]|nr:hypothetical protein PQX77_008758 [Marasmius sp. AFHP31]